MTQMLLYQIHAMQLVRQAKRKLVVELDNDDDLDESLQNFLRAVWLDPQSSEARAYLGVLSPHLLGFD